MTLHRLPSGYVFNDDDVSDIITHDECFNFDEIREALADIHVNERKAYMDAFAIRGKQMQMTFRSRPNAVRTFYKGLPGDDDSDFDAMESLIAAGGTWK